MLDIKIFSIFICFYSGLLRLQQIYQGLRPGNETFQVETVKRIANATNAIDFLRTLEELNRWSKKYIVLDCPTDMAKDIVVYHVRDLSLGRRTYHYLLSGLVSSSHAFISPFPSPVCVFKTFYFVSYNFAVRLAIIGWYSRSGDSLSLECSIFRLSFSVCFGVLFYPFHFFFWYLSLFVCFPSSILWLYSFVRLLLLHHRHDSH